MSSLVVTAAVFETSCGQTDRQTYTHRHTDKRCWKPYPRDCRRRG